jgi:hypothetical protein
MRNIRTPEEALVYMTDCTLATVSRMAGLKRKSKHEFQRQISIAQNGFDFMTRMQIDYTGSRAEHVRDYGGSVAKWADCDELTQ